MNRLQSLQMKLDHKQLSRPTKVKNKHRAEVEKLNFAEGKQHSQMRYRKAHMELAKELTVG